MSKLRHTNYAEIVISIINEGSANMLDLSLLVKVSEMKSLHIEDADQLEVTAKAAREYVLRHSWCSAVDEEFLIYGVAGVFCLFFFVITPSPSAQESAGWVFGGDVPPAYIDVKHAQTAELALRTYMIGMNEWANAVLAGEPIDDMVPVTDHSLRPLEATRENAEYLSRSMDFLNTHVLPELVGPTGSCVSFDTSTEWNTSS